jgi:hypothetical protein
MIIRDMVAATAITVEFFGTSRMVTRLAVGRGLPAGKWRVNLLDTLNRTVSVSAWRIVEPAVQPALSFELDPPVSWETARACHVGFEREGQ